MSKTMRTLKQSRQRAERNWGGLSHDEVLSAVCKYFSRGYSAGEIVQLVKVSHGITLSREDPYRLVSYAAQKGWLAFQAPVDYELSERLEREYRWLEKVEVVRTSVADDISHHVAGVLYDLMLDICGRSGNRKEFHLGLSGGNTLRKASRHFASMLKERREGLPENLVLHAMGGGFTYKENFKPTDANSFFSYFAGEPGLRVNTSFVGLHAPGIVPVEWIGRLKTLPYIKAAYERVNEIQVILTSAGGHWRRQHSIMYDLYRTWSQESLEALNRENVIGDMMWRALNDSGPVDTQTAMRAMTLVELTDLPALITQGKKVILHLGPCGNCGGPKTDVLAAILNSRRPLITHLVCDSRSARGLLE